MKIAKKLSADTVAQRIKDITNSEYSLVSEYTGAFDKISVLHHKCGNVQQVRLGHFIDGRRCPICKKSNRKTNETFKKEVYELTGRHYVFLEKYVTNEHKLKVKHMDCGHIYEVKPANFLSGKRCPKCAKNIPLTTDTFKEQIFDKVGNEYELMDDIINSQTKVKIKHNTCGNIIHMAPTVFNSGTRCSHCHGGVKYHTTDTFKKYVRDKTHGEYDVLGDYKNARTNIKFIHNECHKEYVTEPQNFIAGKRCPHCFGKIKKTTDEFKKEVFALVENEYSVLGEYLNNNIKIKMRHNTCLHEYLVSPASFLGTKNRNGSRCPNCFKNEKKTTEEFREELLNTVGDDYQVIGEYLGANTKIDVLHIPCGRTYRPTPSNLIRGDSRCPCINEKKGEARIVDYLSSSTLNFIRQYSNPNCKHKIALRFDFAIFDGYNEPICLIEFDGKQHYEPIEYFGGIKTFKLQQKKDKIKDNYCESHNIPLIRIKYTEFDNIESILNEKLTQLNILPVPVSPALS
ncbi:DUF2726 domain-containing protein [Paenibacillus sp. EKM102P]|uniref:DUF2726 domain-containing protein n=1 Tax=unclassified Paenibacillus TaxID=185978 RepID=UPI00142D2098|nr:MULTISPECIES: DUF2726 domain-containing protein [unclassified Paenibacillus]KAF6620426.1 DUF2726 domain-containing protein [Paenibacillus sp. EKM101P]KAF6623418.1 DUF2726 domain-containing protein [Paenibacillus sp. EKM102P]KAF6634020.1 DUF2726 domain-containing protein [Paenibacillus sp. EKM10P]KAF6649546.1 DUF2726 domain-containing protein [Paenibacillus sp. EKM11P]